jgi:hypothetical protein
MEGVDLGGAARAQAHAPLSAGACANRGGALIQSSA